MLSAFLLCGCQKRFTKRPNEDARHNRIEQSPDGKAVASSDVLGIGRSVPNKQITSGEHILFHPPRDRVAAMQNYYENSKLHCDNMFPIRVKKKPFYNSFPAATPLDHAHWKL